MIHDRFLRGGSCPSDCDCKRYRKDGVKRVSPLSIPEIYLQTFALGRQSLGSPLWQRRLSDSRIGWLTRCRIYIFSLHHLERLCYCTAKDEPSRGRAKSNVQTWKVHNTRIARSRLVQGGYWVNIQSRLSLPGKPGHSLTRSMPLTGLDQWTRPTMIIPCIPASANSAPGTREEATGTHVKVGYKMLICGKARQTLCHSTLLIH